MSSFIQQIGTLESWVLARAEHSHQPSRYMNLYEQIMKRIMAGDPVEEQPIDLTDAVQAAAEIEALCAHRSLQLYRARTHAAFYEVLREVTQPQGPRPKKERNTGRDEKGRFVGQTATA